MKKLKNTILCLLAWVWMQNTYTQTWMQKGLDIDGEHADDWSGYSVSMPDAKTLGVGALLNFDQGVDAGHTRIYRWNGLAWTQKGQDIDGEAAGDWAGKCISMPDSNTVAVGAPFNEGSAYFSGHVRVYRWNGSTWLQKGIDLDGEIDYDQSGFSVSMPDSNTVAIGAIYNSGSYTYAGHVRVYTWDGTMWIQKGMDIDGEAGDDLSGWFVSMSDAHTVAIGAPYNGGNGYEAGHVRVYRWDGSSWAQKGTDIDGDPGDLFGFSVSMPDSNTVAVGAPNNDANGLDAGRVRVYRWNGSAWTQKGMDLLGEFAGDQSGYSVSMPDTNTVAIDAHGNDEGGNDAGHVRIFRWNGSAWVQKGMDMLGETAGDVSGLSLSMPDSNTVAIGAPWNDGNGNSAGQVRVYSVCSNATHTISLSACDSYVSPSGNFTWNSSGTYVDVLVNASGCDSVITINLTINQISDLSAITDGASILAVDSNATYQWLDCNNDYAVLLGESGQSFTPVSNGSYAVELTQNGCVDTSVCVNILTVDVSKSLHDNQWMIYPNPSQGPLTIMAEHTSVIHSITVRNVLGQEVFSRNQVSYPLELTLEGPSGIYFVEMRAGDQTTRLKVIKE